MVGIIGTDSGDLAIGQLLNTAIFGSITGRQLFLTGMICVSVILLRMISDKKAAEASFLASSDVKRILREKIYEKLVRLGSSYKEQISTSEVVQLSVEGVEQLETYFGRYLPQFLQFVSACYTVCGALLYQLESKSGASRLCASYSSFYCGGTEICQKTFEKYWGSYTELGDSFLENLQGLTTLKIYQSDERKSTGNG